MKNHLIIPHKNRVDCLVQQANHLMNFIKENNLNNDITVNYVEQENEIFNLGYSLNAGYKILQQYYQVDPEDNFWFYPVDILPKKPLFFVEENKTISIAVNKAWGIQVKNFQKVNGWCIDQFGYGHDDHEWWARCSYYGIDRIIKSDIFALSEDFDFIESKQKNGLKNYINNEKNKNLFLSTINQEEVYKKNGLSSTSIDILDRFQLFDNFDNIFYNQFKILNII